MISSLASGPVDVPRLGRTVHPRGRRSAVAVLALSAVGLGAIVSAAPAQAHNYLVSSTPAADSTLTELPDSFDITTNDPLLDVGDGGAFAFQVLDADGRYYGDGCVAIDGAAMTTVPALGEPGDYTVRWQVLSADGHTVSDEFAFGWAPTAETEPSPGSATPPVCGAPATDLPSPSAEPDETPATPATPDDDAAVAGDDDAAASGDTAAAASDDTVVTALWIGGAVLALAIGVITTLLIRSRRARA